MPSGKEKNPKEGELRGCIGTFSKQPLKKNLPLYSYISAFEDTRFTPITMKEVPQLCCTVSLLQNFEKIKDPLDWTVGTHGIEIHFSHKGMDYSGTFLPEVAPAQGWDQTTTLRYLIQKAGYVGSFESVKDKMKTERYQSALHTVSYEEYLAFLDKNEDLFKVSDKLLSKY